MVTGLYASIRIAIVRLSAMAQQGAHPIGRYHSPDAGFIRAQILG